MKTIFKIFLLFLFILTIAVFSAVSGYEALDAKFYKENNTITFEICNSTKMLATYIDTLYSSPSLSFYGIGLMSSYHREVSPIGVSLNYVYIEPDNALEHQEKLGSLTVSSRANFAPIASRKLLLPDACDRKNINVQMYLDKIKENAAGESVVFENVDGKLTSRKFNGRSITIKRYQIVIILYRNFLSFTEYGKNNIRTFESDWYSL